MSFGQINKLVVSLLFFLIMSPALAAGWSIQALMQAFAKVESSNVRYHEEKQLALLRAPLVSEGVLAYRKPDYLKKAMLKPEQESFEVDKGVIALSKNGKITRQIAMNDYPPLTAFVMAYLALLSGDLEGLELYYQHQLSGREENWKLVLEPEEKTMRQYIQKIIVIGSKNAVHSINSIDSEGDSTLMTLQE